MDFFDGDLIHESVTQAYKKVNIVEPDADAYNISDEFVIELEMPGVHKKDVKMSINNGTLTITGKKEFDHNSIEPLLKERDRRNFKRNIILPIGLIGQGKGTVIEIEHINGVFIIHIPKK